MRSNRWVNLSLLTALMATTMLESPARAQDVPVGYPIQGPYVTLGGGFNIKGSESIKNLSGPIAAAGLTTGLSTPNLNFSTSLGGAVSGSVGYGLGNGIRIEAQMDYAGNPIDGLSGVNLSGFGASAGRTGGSEKMWGAMFNALYDFVGFTPYVVPYAGIGIGYQRAHLSGFSATGTGTAAALTPTLTSDDTRASFAAQGILGVAFPLQEVPGLALFADYRIMGLTGTRTYNAGITTTVGGVRRTSVGTMEVGHEYNNTFIFGVRYNFGVSPPPPPAPAAVAAPAPAATRSYLVFFDWDKATLTDRARQIIKEAADNSSRVQYTRIDVNGYTDTSGTPKYNQGLSVRRAQTVAGELVRDGVPQNAITIQGFGDSHLLVPTGPNVREPQNRRVEIVIH